MIRRLISAGLSISMFFGALAVTGCSKKTQKGGKIIAGDSSWYDAQTTEIDDIYKDKKMSYREREIIGAYQDGVLIRDYGQLEYPEGFTGKNGDSSEYVFDDLQYYDADGKLLKSIDLTKVVSEKNNQYINDIIICDGKILLYREDCDTFHDAEMSYYLTDIDVETGEIGTFEKLPYTSKDIPTFHDGTWVSGEYIVSEYSDIGSGKSIFVILNNGQCKIVDVSSSLPSAEIRMISGCMAVSENELVFICSFGNLNFLSLNLESGKVQIKDEEYSWLNALTFNEHISSFGGNSYITDQSGIKRINLETKQLEEIVSFDDCNLNRNLMDTLSLFSVNGDKYVFAGDVYIADWRDQFSFGNPTGTTTLITLTKTETNPNAGKVILTAAFVGNAEVSYSICEAIRLFNDTNEDYFIRLSYNYDIKKNLNYGDAETEDEVDDIYYKTAADLNDLLAINMLAGDGPDIILNAADIRQIQTEDHLVDLSSFLSGKNGINTEDCFSNVIDAAKVNGKLLYMPVSFSVNGLLVNKEDVRDGQTGFTYEEYVKYLDEKCDGNDPMVDTRLGVLCTLYSCMSEPCISGNTVNFDNESFRKLCEYVKNTVPEKFRYNNDLDGNAAYDNIGSFLTRNTFYAPMKTLLGYPSSDACGPYITVDTSIGISASAPSTVVDGAWEFIKTCLSNEVQEVIARDYTNPMNKSVFDSAAKITLENYNKSEMSYGVELDDSVITSYKETLMSASVVENRDPAVLNVIREEMPAYFLDQKTLDAVLSIINNRVTTIIKERGGSVSNQTSG